VVRDVAVALDFLHTKGDPSFFLGWAGWADQALDSKGDGTGLPGDLSRRWSSWQAAQDLNMPTREGEVEAVYYGS
jgi:hypothetical protein